MITVEGELYKKLNKTKLRGFIETVPRIETMSRSFDNTFSFGGVIIFIDNTNAFFCREL